MINQNEFYYIAIDENGEPYIEHGLLKNVGKKAHKYIMKIGEGAKARYFYTKEEVDAYYNKVKNKASDTVKKTTQTAKNASKNAASSVRDAADSVMDTGKKVASNAKSKVDRMKDEFKKRNQPPIPTLSDPNEKIITEDIITEKTIPETILTEKKEIETKKAPVYESARHRPEKMMTKDEIQASINKAKQDKWEKKPNPMNSSGVYPYDELKKDAEEAGLDFSAYEEASREKEQAYRRASNKYEENKKSSGLASLYTPMPYDDPAYKEAAEKADKELKKLTDKLYKPSPYTKDNETKSEAKRAEQTTEKGSSQGTHLLDLSWNEVEDLRSRIYSVRNSAEDNGRTAIVNAANDIYDKLGRDAMTVEEAYAELQKLENNMKKKPTVKDSKSVTTFDNSSNIKTWN